LELALIASACSRHMVVPFTPVAAFIGLAVEQQKKGHSIVA